MKLRKYKDSDSGEVGKIFYETVHTINAKDYTQKQLNIWAPQDTNYLEWGKSRLVQQDVIVAVDNKKIIGFGSINITSGYLDLLFVQKDNIGKGVGTAICDELEKRCRVNGIITFASVTARPFFEKRGYEVVEKNKVKRNRARLCNYLMAKYIEGI